MLTFFPLRTMDSTLSNHIIQHVKDSYCWIQPFYVIPDENIIVNLAEVISENATVLSNAPDQPMNNISKGPNSDYLDLFVVTQQL